MIFFLFHIENEGNVGGLLGEAKGFVGPTPRKLLGGATPSSFYAYDPKIKN